MPAPRVLVFTDVIDHLVDYMNAAGDEKNLRTARRCAIEAYDELVLGGDWSYFWKPYYLSLEAKYSTGTITYTHSGGTYPRQLTLASGTWPTNAVYYTIRISSVDYAVEDRKSDTVLTLDANRNPGANVAAGTSYVAYRSGYTLPGDYRGMCFPSTPDDWYSCYVHPSEWHAEERLNTSSGDPTMWTVLGDENLVGSQAVHVWPYPSTAKSYAMLYQRFGRKLLYTGYEADAYSSASQLVSGTAASRDLTGSGTAFAADMIGCVIRFGTSANVPDGDGGLKQYKEQKVIVARTDATTGTLDSVLTNTFTNVKFRISSLVDLRPTMIPAFLRGAELQCAIVKNMDRLSRAQKLYDQTLLLCKEAESEYRGRRGVNLYGRARDQIGDVDEDMD